MKFYDIHQSGGIDSVQNPTTDKTPFYKAWKFYKKWTFWVVVIYLSLVVIYTVCLIFSKGENRLLNSNELGDFLAGVFAPLAFLFLYLGYLQQGKELKISNEAFKKQCEELKNSVEQQSKLVSFQQQEMEAKYFAAKPFLEIKKPLYKFDVEHQPIYHDNGETEYKDPEQVFLLKFSLKNLGEVAKHITITDSNKMNELDSTYEIKKDSTVSIVCYIDDKYALKLFKTRSVEFSLNINYSDIYGKKYQDFVIVELDEFDGYEGADLQVRISKRGHQINPVS